MKGWAIVALALLSGCSPPSAGAHTLYRNSVLDPNMRVHVASFDAAEGDSYNAENCETARSLFQRQGGVSVRFWCEKGRFNK